MTEKEFCIWLRGFFEIREIGKSKLNGCTEEQLELIKKNLYSIFNQSIKVPSSTPLENDVTSDL